MNYLNYSLVLKKLSVFNNFFQKKRNILSDVIFIIEVKIFKKDKLKNGLSSL